MIFEQCKENKRFINVKALIIKFVLFFLVLEEEECLHYSTVGG